MSHDTIVSRVGNYTIVYSERDIGTAARPTVKSRRIAARMKKNRDERRRTRNMNRQLELLQAFAAPNYDGY